ncbi:uncharacterized protein [Heptranchias perlo]|uniref:uncharacterized protein n=1 Tax=Heptranchias perlo TaxID=212740 RepID=UPI00355ABA52
MASTVAKRRKPKFSTLAMRMLVKQFTKLQRIFLATKPKMPTSEGHRRGWNLIATKVDKVSKVVRTAEDCLKRINDLRLGARQKVAFNKKRGTVQHADVAKDKVLTWEEEKVAPIFHLVEHGPDASSDSSDSDDCCTSKPLRSEQQRTTVILEEDKVSTQHQEPGVAKEGVETEEVQQGSRGEHKDECTGGQRKATSYMKVPSSEKTEIRGTRQPEATGAVPSSFPSQSQNTHEGELCPICRRLDTLVSTVQRGFNHIHRDINTLQNASQYRGARLSQNVMSLVGAMHTLVRLHHFSTLPRRDVAIQTSIVLTESHLENVGAASSDTVTTSSDTVTTSSDTVTTSSDTVTTSSDAVAASSDTVIEVSLDPDGDSAESMSIEYSSQNSSDSDW